MNRTPRAAPSRTRRPSTRAIAAATLATTLGLLTGPPAATVAPLVTRAALDPALVAGKGAQVAFLEQVAENAVTDGTVIGPDRNAYTLPSEVSGRRAVRLLPGQHVEFVLPAAANAITVRYGIPDGAHRRRVLRPRRRRRRQPQRPHLRLHHLRRRT